MNSLSAIKEAPIQPEQLEFNFEGYDEEPLPEKSFATAETLTLNAITSASDFTDLFEDARCISRIYGNNEENPGLYYIFHAHDAVTGRNIAIKATNPLLYEAERKLEDCLKWESKVLQILKGKHRMQQILTPCKTMQTNIQLEGKNYIVPVSFFSSIYGHRCAEIFF